MRNSKAEKKLIKNKLNPRVVSIDTAKRKPACRKNLSQTVGKKKPEQCIAKGNLKCRKINDSGVKARRAKKLEQRRREKRIFTAQDWAAPAPSNLVAQLDIPKVKTKYQSYFEFTDNPEKKEKKLEFQVTNKLEPPPGYAFVPIGDPSLTNACKELSREKDAMIFIVSTCKSEQSKIAEHVYRIGFHFRETIIDEAREFLGERPNFKTDTQGITEPIPELQIDINKQADAAIRDLFPRIPNTDRQMVIEHAFKKGAMFQGEPTVGMQSNIPLSRRVQLAVLAHIRHNHTRYDKLLRETSWINARKVVEPVCLDVILKWRGDEETGRDQMDEILREVVIISDSESDSESDFDNHLTSKANSSDEEGEVTSSSNSDIPSQSIAIKRANIKSQCNAELIKRLLPDDIPHESFSSGVEFRADRNPKDNLSQRSSKRYQAAWDSAIRRQLEGSTSFADGEILYRALPSTRCCYPTRVESYNEFSPEKTCKAKQNSSLPRYHVSVNQIWRHGESGVLSAAPPRFGHYSTGSARIIERGELSKQLINECTTSNKYVHHPIVPLSRYHVKRLSPANVIRPGVQDVPVQSIEKSSDNHSSRNLEGRYYSGEWTCKGGEPSTRHIGERRFPTPVSHNVIIIDHDSPPMKYHRAAYENGPDRFEPYPLHKRGADISVYNSDYHSETPSLNRWKKYDSRHLNTCRLKKESRTALVPGAHVELIDLTTPEPESNSIVDLTRSSNIDYGEGLGGTESEHELRSKKHLSRINPSTVHKASQPQSVEYKLYAGKKYATIPDRSHN
ncbi:hypothetical protein BGHDH14_bgh02873 [Blumeria hordei DH14]|uniref:DUF2293 domain-containing protein n=1 Tax=Blumeria graminis f. sp. hordei (strain DH14) TaxID=546991 RepID=N1J9P4_BLUG1|nr:hypothetical protein BGHDH14_bgh02873 [Blumeria hordei DH14]